MRRLCGPAWDVGCTPVRLVPRVLISALSVGLCWKLGLQAINNAHLHLLSGLNGDTVCSSECLAPLIGYHKTAAMLATGCEEQHRRTEAIARFYERYTCAFDSSDSTNTARCHDFLPMWDVRFATL